VYYSLPIFEESNIQIVDELGKEIFKQNLGLVSVGSVSVPVKNWKSGTYFLSFISGKQKIIQKVIKN
jgi:hypothetical protein